MTFVAAVGSDSVWAYYLTLGMVATVNPCGFAMLPAYLSYFLGLEGEDAGEAEASVTQAFRVRRRRRRRVPGRVRRGRRGCSS